MVSYYKNCELIYVIIAKNRPIFYLCIMIVKTAIFVSSNNRVDKLPAARLPEYAFIGRSNVGKSSLINALTGNRNLAKTSQTPGKTQLINHFLINDAWYLVDLPGYGFAKVSKSSRATWEKFIRRYLLLRENLQCVFVLIDSRHEPQRIDLDFCYWLGENRIPFMLVFTKADKLSALKSQSHIEKFRNALLQWFEEVPAHFLTSAENRLGCDELLAAIDEINTNFDSTEVS
ncbi:putative GTP-binding protein EngB [Parapedobacter defluvii]|uniref:Probable GTP-binding protein EngB n=2 Tax=Parapedobacter defluvii TaxID=2045106 RepID=A0ABQ1MYW8_9SPHI|nr:putative GTP-binding protein EngB [Parapedobacter defluvii]